MRITLDASRIRFELIDADTVNAVYQDEYVKEQYRNDIEEYEFTDREGVSYIGIFVDGDLGGFFYCVDISTIEIEVHLAFLAEYTPYSRIICATFIDWLFENRKISRLTTYVMDYRRVAVNLALKLGFKYEGFMQKCMVRDGVWYGKHVLGIVR